MMPYSKPQIRLSRVILPAHAADLKASALDMTTAGLAGVYSISHSEAHDFGIRGAGDLSGLSFPYWDVNKQSFSDRFIRVKPDARLTGRKYLQPVGETPTLYFIPGITKKELDNTCIPVLFAEGEKKSLSLHRALRSLDHSGLVVGLGGVWSWRWSPKQTQPDGKLGKGKSRPIDEFDIIAWRGRTVFLIFDSDVATNPKVAAAEHFLARELRGRGATVRIVRIHGRDQWKKSASMM